MKDTYKRKEQLIHELIELRQQIAELKTFEKTHEQAEAQIRQSKEFLENVINAISDPLFVKDEQHRWVILNDAACEVMGHPREELIGKSDYDLFPKEQADVFWARDDMVLKNGTPDINIEEITWHGKRHIISTRKSLFKDSLTGKRFVAGTIRDVTEKKLAEEELQNSERWLKTILDSVQCGILIINAETHRIIEANPAAIKMINAPKKQIIGNICHQYVCPAEIRRCPITDLNQKMDSSERVLLNALGEKIPILKDVTSVMINDRKLLIESFIDISDQKKAENALRENEEKFRNLAEGAPFGLSIMNYDKTFEYFNPKFTEILGYTIEDIPNKQTWFRKAYPSKKYRDHVINVWREDFVESIKSGEIKPRIFTVKCKDGQDKIIHFRAVGLKDGKQILTYEDITERRKNEEALHFRYEFEKLITRLSTDFINLSYEKIDEGIHFALKAIGEFAHVDRSYIFLLSEDGKRLTNTHEWCANGIKSQKHKIQDVHVESFPWALGKINKNEIIYIPRIEDLQIEAQAEKEEFKAQGIKSVISVPIILGGNCMGALGFASVREERKWPEEIISLLKIVGNIISNLLDRKRAEKSLRESEARLRTAIESLPFDFFMLDENGHYAMQNSACKANWGEIIGKQPDDICQDQNTLNLWKTNNNRAFTGEIVKGEVSFKTRGKDKFYYNIISPIHENKVITGILGVNIDITDRKKAEALLKESEEKYRLISENLPIAVYSALPDKHLATVFVSGNIKELTGYSNQTFLKNPAFWEIIIHPDDKAQAREKIKAHRVNKTQLDIEYRIITKNNKIKWIRDKATPLLDENGQVILIYGFMEDITDSKQTEESLRFLSSLAEQSTDSILCTDKEFRINYMNKAAEELFGWRLNEVKGERPDFLNIEPNAIEIQESIYSTVSSGKTFLGEALNVKKNGDTFYCQFKVSPLFNKDGSIYGYMGSQRDITDRKKAEILLKESEERYHSIFNQAQDGIVLIDVETGQIADCNPAFEHQTGRSLSQLKKMQVWEMRPPEKVEAAKRKFKDIRMRGKGESSELEFQKPNGEIVYIEFVSKIVNIQHKQYIQSMVRDITARRMAEEALRDSEERLELTLKGADLGLWDFDLQTGKVVRNERTAEIFGYSLDEMMPNVHMWESRIHPDDKPRVLEKRDSHLAGRTPLFEAEYRLRTKSGDWRWLLTRGKVVKRDKDGNPLRLTGTLLDITERKTAEQRLQGERDKAQQFLDIAGVMIVMIDIDCKVRLINKKGCQILGYKEKEIIGKEWFESFIPKRVWKQVKVVEEKLRAGEAESVEYFENPVLTKGGEERIMSWHNTLLYDQQGRIAGVLCSGEDITERKRAEEALRKSENKYRTLVENIPQKIFLKDTNSVYISCNENYAKDLKIKPDEISGKTDYDFYPKRLAEKYRTDDQRIVRSGKTEGLEERYIQDGKRSWIYILKTPIRDEDGHVMGILGIFWDITERKKSQQALEAFTKELGRQKKALEEKNIALREVLGQLAVEKSKMQEDVIANINELILPIVKRLQLKGASREYMQLLERNLEDITSSFGRKITKKTVKLTPKEIEICNMVKNGLTSKEISNLLNISFQTVVKHRKNIRKKLHISKKDINLHSFLQQL